MYTSFASLLVFPLSFFITTSLASPTDLSDTLQSEEVSEIIPRATCPKVWTDVAADLSQTFSGCQQPTRFAIRFAFHDAGGYSSKTKFYAPAAGGADGSLLLNDEEIARSSQNPMQNFRNFLLGKYNKYKAQGVGAADLVQFAGALAIASCPGGPIVPTVVGRKDNSQACPDGLLPDGFGPGADYDVLIDLFEDKGFSPTDLAALVGAHTVAQAFAQVSNGMPPGAPQDTTPSTWDTKFFKQTQNGKLGVFSFDSDVNLSNKTTEAGKAFMKFGKSKAAWDTAFTSAMQRLSVLGIPAKQTAKFTDCTSVISNQISTQANSQTGLGDLGNLADSILGDTPVGSLTS